MDDGRRARSSAWPRRVIAAARRARSACGAAARAGRSTGRAAARVAATRRDRCWPAGSTPENVGRGGRAACGRSASTCRRASRRRPASRITERLRGALRGAVHGRSTRHVGRRDPDARGYFGAFGGRFVPETLVAPVEELERAYFAARDDAGVPRGAGAAADALRRAADAALRGARGCRRRAGGARIFLKREDLTHTGAHKINNALGQALLAARMGKRRIVAETGAGQHGVATRDGVRAARPRVRRLHGRRGHGAPGAERVPHAAARRRGPPASTPAAAR